MSDGHSDQISRAEQAQRAREHYERIWQTGGDGWRSAIGLAIDAWEREPELLAQIERLRGENRRLVENWNIASKQIREHHFVFNKLNELVATLGFVADRPEAPPTSGEHG